MGRPSNAFGTYPGAGCFATARRAHIDGLEIERLHKRGVGVQNIAQQLGCSMEDVRRVLSPAHGQPSPEAANDDVPPPESPMPPPAGGRSTEAETFRALWLSDLTRTEIRARMGISGRRLNDLRMSLRLPLRQPGRRPESGV